MKKRIIVYFSLTGSTKSVANDLAKILDCDAIRLKTKLDFLYKGILKYLLGGFQSILKLHPTLKKYTLKLADYDEIIIGTPIWAAHITPAIRSFLNKEHITNKRIALFSCSYDEKSADTALKEIKKRLNESNDIISLKEFKEPIKKNSNRISEVQEWVNSFTYV